MIDPGGLVTPMLLGIAGASIGGFLAEPGILWPQSERGLGHVDPWSDHLARDLPKGIEPQDRDVMRLTCNLACRVDGKVNK